MEEKHIDLLVSITGLEKEFITNSIKTDGGTTIILNQFREKNKVFKKEDFELRENNLKEDHNSTYLTELIEMAKNQKLPSLLYNAAANNIISAQNKKLAAEFGIEMDDYSNTENVYKSVKEELSTVDNEQLQKDFDAQALTIKGFTSKFEGQETDHLKAIKENNIKIAYTKELNDFPIDFETDEELKSRRTVADSVFNNMFVIDIQNEKTVILDKEGNILKNNDTKEPLTIQAVFDTEISKYVPMKKERSPTNRKPGDPKPDDNTKVTRESIDKQIETGELEGHSTEHIALEKKLKDQD